MADQQKQSPAPYRPPKVESLPHDIDAEINVLGSILRDNRLIPAVVQKVRVEDFYRDAHRVIYEAILKLDIEGKPVDFSLLENKLKEAGTLEKAGGREYLLKVLESVPVPVNATHYAQIVLICATRRAAITALMTASHNLTDESEPVPDLLSDAEKGIGLCRERLSAGERIDLDKLAREVFDQIEAYKYPEKRGLGTGFLDLDKLTGGIRKNHFVVIAGRPGLGKSQFSFNIARKAIALKKKVLVVSLEMTAHDIFYSMLVSEARVSASRVQEGFSSEEELQRMLIATGCILDSKCLWIEQPRNNDLYAVKALIREHHQNHGLDLIIIDYLQMMEVHQTTSHRQRIDNRQSEVAAISRTTKMMTREFNIPVIGICQLNRGTEGREDHRPRLSDLRESGSLEMDADIVLLLYRDDYYNKDSPTPNICEIDVAKNRGGRTGVVEVVFMRDMLRFEDKADAPVGDGFAPPSDARFPD